VSFGGIADNFVANDFSVPKVHVAFGVGGYVGLVDAGVVEIELRLRQSGLVLRNNRARLGKLIARDLNGLAADSAAACAELTAAFAASTFATACS
jgi:hypothetical protein